jgi:hypothetical protein
VSTNIPWPNSLDMIALERSTWRQKWFDCRWLLALLSCIWRTRTNLNASFLWDGIFDRRFSSAPCMIAH